MLSVQYFVYKAGRLKCPLYVVLVRHTQRRVPCDNGFPCTADLKFLAPAGHEIHDVAGIQLLYTTS